MNKLEQCRLANNLRQKDIAKIINVSESTYKNYESERQIPPIDIALKLADIFNVTAEYLFSDNNNTIKISNEEKNILDQALKILNKEIIQIQETNRQRAYKRDNIKTGDIINNGSEQKVIIGGNNNKID